MLSRLFAPKVKVSAHCDLPCGVYDPAQARIEAESVKAVQEKMAANDDPHFHPAVPGDRRRAGGNGGHDPASVKSEGIREREIDGHRSELGKISRMADHVRLRGQSAWQTELRANRQSRFMERELRDGLVVQLFGP